MGSGSTGVAALATQRNFIGVEQDPEFFEIAYQRAKSVIWNGGSEKMNIAERANYIGMIIDTIKESTQKYHAVQVERNCKVVSAGCGIELSDSRESIKRRCLLAREELLKIMKELEEVY